MYPFYHPTGSWISMNANADFLITIIAALIAFAIISLKENSKLKFVIIVIIGLYSLKALIGGGLLYLLFNYNRKPKK